MSKLAEIDEIGVRGYGKGAVKWRGKMLRSVIKILCLNYTESLLIRKIAGVIAMALVLVDPISGCACHRPWVVGLKVHALVHAEVCWHPPLDSSLPTLASGR